MRKSRTKLSELSTPKYEVGDVVYQGYKTREQVAIECPQCLGEKGWNTKTPAGNSYYVVCKECRGSGTIFHYSYFPRVKKLTIGSVRINTDEWDTSEGHISYMCEETGIGSGIVYYEGRGVLHRTHIQALAFAEKLCEEANSEDTEGNNNG